MKQKNIIIGAFLITLLFGLAMSAIGFNAIASANASLAGSRTGSATTAQVIQSNSQSLSSIQVPPTLRSERNRDSGDRQ